MNLLDELRQFDGKHTTSLEKLASRLAGDDDAVGLLLAAAESDEPKLQTAATWVLKQLHDAGRELSASDTNELLNLLGVVESWEARLHLLQMLPTLSIPRRKAKPLFQSLAISLDAEENKFVRAWTYNALVVIADQHDQLRDEAAEHVARGQDEEAASVKARIRNAAKSVDWL